MKPEKIDKSSEIENMKQLKGNIILLEEGVINLIQSTVKMLMKIVDFKDLHSANRQRRTGLLAQKIVKEMQLSREKMNSTIITANIHDVGKLGINLGVLKKEGKLTGEEYLDAKNHAKISRDILRKFPPFEEISEYALLHHERIDGSGYYGLSGGKIPIESRITAVADTADAMLSKSPYSKSSPLSETMLEIHNEKLFDPRVAEAFISVCKKLSFSAELIHPDYATQTIARV